MSLASLNHPLVQKTTLLKDRALMLRKARDFFHSRHILEVDCPALSAAASIDAHIDLIPAIYSNSEIRYLHSSPEYCMKRLLAEGMGDIYQLSHVFRDKELGSRHQPEFMMAEWYRLGFTFEKMIEETVAFIHLFLSSSNENYEVISYRQAFQHFAQIDYLHASDEELRNYLDQRGIPSQNEEREHLLNLILGLYIEPHLGTKGVPTVLAYYPASQAALAQTKWHGDEQVAERFEVYFQGIELANGYHELADANEQEKRFLESNEARLALGKQPLPIDYLFLDALRKGLPDCCGVAVGFDRLMMLRHQKKEITEVLPISWEVRKERSP